MSHTYSEFLPSYSVGVDCYKAIPEIANVVGAGPVSAKKERKTNPDGISGRIQE